jgi:flagellar hook-associated protein 3 FlgL
MIENAVRAMGDNLEALSRLQTKAASGKKFEKPSDDPKAAQSAFNLRTSLRSTQAFLETAHTADEWMAANEMAFNQMIDMATKAINASLSGVSDSNDDEVRPTLAGQIDSYLASAIEIGNTRYQGQYIFSGFKTTTEPFTFVAGSPDTVSYSGDFGVIQRDMGIDQSMTVNVNGDTAFSPLYGAMITARDALLANDVPALQSAIDDLNSAVEVIKQQRSFNGAREKQVQGIVANLEQTELTIEGWISDNENANLVEVITQLRYQETVYQAALEVGNRTLATINLFDLLS